MLSTPLSPAAAATLEMSLRSHYASHALNATLIIDIELSPSSALVVGGTHYRRLLVNGTDLFDESALCAADQRRLGEVVDSYPGWLELVSDKLN